MNATINPIQIHCRGIDMRTDQVFRWLPFGVQIAAYLWLAWVIFFSGFDRRIPVPYMATHVVFGIHTLIVLGAVGVRFVHGPAGIWMTWVVAAYIPIVIAEIVIYLMR